MAAMLRGAQIARDRAHDDRAWLAWHVAALQRMKRLPQLKKLQTRGRAPKAQTWEQQLAAFEQIARAHNKGLEKANGHG